MAQLMTPAIRNGLYKEGKANAILSATTATKDEKGSVIPATLSIPFDIAQDLNNALNKYLNEVSSLGTGINISSTGSSFKNKNLNKSSVDKRKEANKKMKDNATNLKKDLIKKQKENAKAKYNKIKNDITTKYKETLQAYKDGMKQINKDYSKGGNGRKAIDEKCDQIDIKYNKLTEEVKSVIAHVTIMLSKVPMPTFIGTGSPNPGYSLLTMFSDIKVILVEVQDIIMLIKEIINLILSISPLFDLALLTALTLIIGTAKTAIGNVSVGANNGIEAARNMQATPVFPAVWICDYRWEDDFENMKSVPYTITEFGIPTVMIKKVPSRKRVEYNCRWVEETFKDPIGWKKPVYGKQDTTTVTIDNQDITIVTNAEITGYDIYSDKECKGELLSSNNPNGFIIPGEENSSTTASMSKTPDGKYTVLSLSDGRKVTIDRDVNSGQIVKLNDGTIVNVQ